MKISKFLVTMTAVASAFTALSAFEAKAASSGWTYSVPVPAELEPYAFFEIPQGNSVCTPTHITVSYLLPEELVGTGGRLIELSGENHMDGTPISLEGPKGKAVCSADLQARALICTVKYQGLNIDPRDVASILARKSTTQRELQGRMDVASRFSGDPIGIVTYPFQIENAPPSKRL